MGIFFFAERKIVYIGNNTGKFAGIIAGFRFF
jgi:hypothetical protein